MFSPIPGHNKLWRPKALLRHQKPSNEARWRACVCLVPRGGFEPPWEFSHHALNVARLPFRHLGKSGIRESGNQGRPCILIRFLAMNRADALLQRRVFPCLSLWRHRVHQGTSSTSCSCAPSRLPAQSHRCCRHKKPAESDVFHVRAFGPQPTPPTACYVSIHLIREEPKL